VVCVVSETLYVRKNGNTKSGATVCLAHCQGGMSEANLPRKSIKNMCLTYSIPELCLHTELLLHPELQMQQNGHFIEPLSLKSPDMVFAEEALQALHKIA
jgi:hypothetical protein